MGSIVRFIVLLICLVGGATEPARAWVHGAPVGPQGYAQIGLGDVQGPSYAFLDQTKSLFYFFGTSYSNSSNGPDFPKYLDSNQLPTQNNPTPNTLAWQIRVPIAEIVNSGTCTGSCSAQAYQMRWTGGGSTTQVSIGTGVSGLTVTSGGVSCPSCIINNTGSLTTIKGANIKASFSFTRTDLTTVNGSFDAGSFTGFANFQICQSGNATPDDCARLDNGEIINPVYIAAVAGAKPKTIRTMDWSGTNQGTFTQYKYRNPATGVGWLQVSYQPGTWAGQITGTNNYTVGLSAPAFPDAPASWPANSAGNTPTMVWQGYFQNTSSSNFPTIAVAGLSGVKDLISATGDSPLTLFNGTVVNADSAAVNFLTPFAKTISYSVTASNPVASGPCSNGSSSSIIPGAAAGLCQAINADATAQAAFVSAGVTQNSSSQWQVVIYSKFSGTTFSTTYTGSGTTTLPVIPSLPQGTGSGIATNKPSTLIYDPLLDKVMYFSGGFVAQVPVEAHVALANAVRANLWFNLPAMSDDTAVASYAAYIKGNLNPALYAYFESANEQWNFGFNQTHWAQARGQVLGWPIGQVQQVDSWYALRQRQIMGNITTAWGGATNLRRVLASDAIVSLTAGHQKYRLEGFDLNEDTYPYYCAYAGGTYSAGSCSVHLGYNTSPNRPVDKSDVQAYATYFQGAILTGPTSFGGTYATGDLSDCATPGTNSGGLTCAIKNYNFGVANSNQTYITAAYQWIDNDVRQGTKNGLSPSSTLAQLALATTGNTGGPYANWESVAACYDGNGGSSFAQSCSGAGRNQAGLPALRVENYEGAAQFTWPSISDANAIGISTNFSVASFTGSIATGNPAILTVTAVASGSLSAGVALHGTGVSSSQGITAQLTGTGGANCPDVTCNGTTGTYSVVTSQAIASEAMTADNASISSQNMVTGFRGSSFMYTLVTNQFQQVMGTFPNGPNYALNGLLPHSWTPSYFNFQGPFSYTIPWDMMYGSIYATPYTMQAYPAVRDFVGRLN